MTNKTTEALKLAEEALRFYVEDFDCAAADVIALAAIREALAEQELYEPEGRCKECLAYNGHLGFICDLSSWW